MEKEQRSKLQKATQEARRLLEEEFSRQLLETYDINVAAGRWSEEPGAHLQAEQRLLREKLLAWIEHRSSQINDEKEALLLALREMAFTALNRFVALKLMEARELVRPCVSGGLESEGFQDFTAVAQGLVVDQESSYRLYLETIFEDVSRELRALFDPRDPASLLWPKRTALLELLDILNRLELAELWREDETLGWIYQYFNGDAERKKMREESSAPRNSRELAVRNQFFTPRYVVEFLTDNSLGRIWYEMRQGDTGLKERCRYLVRRPNEIWLQPGEEAPAEVVADDTLTQEELLRQAVHIPYRPLKDPREIRMLDPACGSMHFGLYAFDLYLAIYEEAWEIAQGSDEQAKQGEAFAPFVAHAADFASKAAFLREVPRLILQHNIHGVDIDPRATQIARLTLWLRAQRAWQEQGVDVAARPAITRSNVVCAEPMPGERELLADFVDQQFPEAERGLVQQLLEVIFDKMQLAGEAGSLLKIEEEIRDAIDQARRGWQKLAIQQRDLFSAAEMAELGGVGSSLNTDLQNLTKDFWVNIEERIYASLSDYANQAESGGYQRRLFAEDAAGGFAFIDVCRKRYDSITMNPPFGEPSSPSSEYLQNTYEDSRFDIYAVFVELCLDLLSHRGRLGVISSRTGFFLSSLTRWRRRVLAESRIDLWLDQGYGVMDEAMVSAASYVLSKDQHTSLSTIIPWLDTDAAMRDANTGNIDQLTQSGKRIILFNLSRLIEIPGSTLCYWLQNTAIDHLSKSPRFKRDGRDVRQGMASGDNFRFLRLYWEIPTFEATHVHEWAPYAKGGDYSPFYRDIELCINWSNGGREVKTVASILYGSESRTIKSQDKYFKPGLTFTIYTVKGFNIRPLPSGCVFDVAGSSVFCDDATQEDLFYLLGYLSSPIFQYFISALSDDRKWQVGLLQNVPWISPSTADKSAISANSMAAFGVAREMSFLDETDHLYRPPCLSVLSIRDFSNSLKDKTAAARLKINELRDRNTILLSTLYGLDPIRLDRAANFQHENTLAKYHIDTGFSWSGIEEAANFVLSNLLGAVFGRWDARLMTSAFSDDGMPDPFAPLPLYPLGALSNKASPSTQEVDASISPYPISINCSGILVEDESHAEDVVQRILDVMHVIWRERSPLIEHEMCSILGANSLRAHFLPPSAFFTEHLKRYSKSRRQAPIYWQLSAGNGNYSAWLYYHRFTQDTLYRVLRDFVEPRIQQAEREQFELESQGALSGDAATRLQGAQSLLLDLKLFKNELDLVAPLWNPNLNDGVIINHAILWRITPYTSWQKKCKECWDKLVSGDYDWAHLAFHLWPERVIRKCTTDRSLAIAHGLEERLWQETSKGNWLQRQVSEAELQALLVEYSKPAVQNALERFLAASPPVAAARTRAPRAAKSSSTGTTRRPRGSAPEVDAETSRQTLLVLTAAPAEGLGRNAIAELLAVEAASLTAVIKQLKEGGQIEQLGAARGAKYRLTESGLAAVESQAGENQEA